MKKFILRNGLYSAGFLLAVSLLLFVAMGGASGSSDNYGMGEIFGWLSIVLSLSFIFLGIHQYRRENEGPITFGQVLKMGLLISLFPSVLFALYNIFYIEVLDPQFFEKYYDYQLEQALATANPSEHAEIEKTMAAEYTSFANVPFQTFLMFASVFLIGTVMSVISGLVFSRK